MHDDGRNEEIMLDGRNPNHVGIDSTIENENILPVLPLFGFDNSDELEQDLSYIKQLYPRDVLQIQKEVEFECDKLEYDGSPMYHAYPDKVFFEGVANHIYANIAKTRNESNVSAANLRLNPHRDHRCFGRHCCPGGYCGYDGHDHNPWLKNTVNVLLFGELLNRRRRYRSYKRIF